MDNRTEKDFWIEMSIREIWTQAHFAEIAYSNINPKAVSGTDMVFSSIHSFLSHCANISKMLVANDGEIPPKIIGDILGISKNSDIHNRKFRNHLEHYDERLKMWIKEKGVNANIGTYNIGPKSMIKIPNIVFVSHYDPTDNVFTFVNEDIKLNDLFKEVIKIKELANNWVEKIQPEIIKPPFA
jgi:hypothetical protein